MGCLSVEQNRAQQTVANVPEKNVHGK